MEHLVAQEKKREELSGAGLPHESHLALKSQGWTIGLIEAHTQDYVDLELIDTYYPFEMLKLDSVASYLRKFSQFSMLCILSLYIVNTIFSI